MKPTRFVAPALGVSALAFAHLAAAQPCTGPGFLAGEPGDSGIADPHSAYVGPMTTFDGRLVIGGAFSQAGPLATNLVASFDPASSAWSPLGSIDIGSTNGYAAALHPFTIAGTPNLILVATSVRRATTVTLFPTPPRWRGGTACRGTT